MTFQRIKKRNVSEYVVEGPLEQETDIIKAKTHANDKWAQQGTHGAKGKIGGPTGRPADLLVGRLARGPHRLQVPRGGLPLVAYGGLMRLGCSSPRGSLVVDAP